MFEQLKNEPVKAHLTAAASEENLTKAAEHVSAAFLTLIAGVRMSKFGLQPIAFEFLKGTELPESVERVLISMQEVLMIQSLGIDFAKYHKFKTVVKLPGFGWAYSFQPGEGDFNLEHKWWSIAFVVDCTLHFEALPDFNTYWKHVGKPDLSV